mmetsp:Transcript_6864/g.19338  ORF Transcript_6864/g.19338 Transcript_6864/m.19338 type:complete len:220 (+) Transcript_6864:1781-2440(+)
MPSPGAEPLVAGGGDRDAVRHGHRDSPQNQGEHERREVEVDLVDAEAVVVRRLALAGAERSPLVYPLRDDRAEGADAHGREHAADALRLDEAEVVAVALARGDLVALVQDVGAHLGGPPALVVQPLVALPKQQEADGGQSDHGKSEPLQHPVTAREREDAQQGRDRQIQVPQRGDQDGRDPHPDPRDDEVARDGEQQRRGQEVPEAIPVQKPADDLGAL